MNPIRYSLVLLVLTAAFAFATVPPAKNAQIPEHLRASMKKIQADYDQGYWAERFRADKEARALGLKKSGAAATETLNVPIIFGKYSNASIKIQISTFQELLFDGPNPTGTMTQFYMENSYNKLYMTGKCLGWFPVPRTFEYYVHDGGTRNAGLEYGGPDFTIDVLVEADKTVDFSKYVKYVDAEGAHVPQLGIVHTGADAASGADNIWSHRWNVRSRLNLRKADANETIVNPTNVTAAGRYITNDMYQGLPVIFDGDYAIQPELSGSSNTSGNPKAIGVFTHEFGHVFGLPDLYDTDNTSEGLGNWCLMAGGSYGGDGGHEATPSHMSAWCKEQLGWTAPTVITSYQPQYKFRSAEMYPDVVRINVRGQTGGQYFLVENRQKIGYDKYLPNSGLLIFHVDPSRSNNTNESRYKVDLEQADGLRNLNLKGNRGDAGDSYPGSNNNRNFDGTSTPNSNDYSSLASYVGVRNISNSDTAMFADLDVGTRPYFVLQNALLTEGLGGNANGRIDAGETGTMRLKFQNIYPVGTNAAQVKVTTTASDVTIDSSAKQLAVAGLYTVDSVFSINVSAAPNAAARIIPVTVRVTTADGMFQKTIETMLGYPGTVLVDLDSTAENIGNDYRKMLDKTGKYYELVAARDNSITQMQLPYRAKAIVFSGRKKTNIITDSIAQKLLEFQNAGGDLFITGQNILEDMTQRNSPHRSELLRATWTKNVAFGKILIGKSNDVLGASIPKLVLGGGDAVPNQVSPDEFNADSTVVHPMFRWNTVTGTNYGGLWWQHPSNGSKLVFFSFGLEGANDSSAGVTAKSSAVLKVLNWFDGVTSAPDEDALLPHSIALFDNYPNPFNPATTIAFSLPSEQIVTLTVYDMLGREVRTLVNEKRSAGNHTVSFSASDLSSGMYFYSLRSGNFTETKRMMVLK